MPDYAEMDSKESSKMIDILIFVLNKVSVKLVKGPAADWERYMDVILLICLQMKTFDVF
jgi:hypothetical protein